VDEDAVFVEEVIRVPANVRALLHKQYALARVGGQPFGKDTAGEPGANDQVVKHSFTPAALPRVVRGALGTGVC
jgi:hypothetical protein